MFKTKNAMSPAIVSDTFLPGMEIIKILSNEMTFLFTLYTNARNLSFLDAKMLKSISKELTLESSLRTYKEPIKL